MRTIVCTKLGKTVEEALQNLSEQIKPIPNPKPNEVVVKVAYGALNFFDTLILTGKYQFKYTPPFIPGSELSGTVYKIGSKVTKFKVGDRICGFPLSGAFAEYTTCNPRNIWKMPNNMTFEAGASFVMTYGTSYMSLIQRAQINQSQTVLITAASGGCGTACAQIARAVGCKKIIGCVGSEPKMKVAKQCGCDLVINYRENPEWGKQLKKKKIGIDVFVDIVGGAAWNQGLKSINWYGKAVIIGFTSGTIPKIKANRVLLKNIDVLGISWGATGFHDYKTYDESVKGAL
eukprot:436587_1